MKCLILFLCLSACVLGQCEKPTIATKFQGIQWRYFVCDSVYSKKEVVLLFKRHEDSRLAYEHYRKTRIAGIVVPIALLAIATPFAVVGIVEGSPIANLAFAPAVIVALGFSGTVNKKWKLAVNKYNQHY
jgi:hypothetical protein